MLTAAAAVLAIPTPARGEITQADLVLVTADDVVSEDLYAAGNRILIEGRVEGDLYALAFEEVEITGEVTGDVVAIAGRVSVRGRVGGSLRAAAAAVSVAGGVAEDVVVVAWNTGLTDSGAVGRDLLNWGRNGALAGAVDRDVLGRFSRLELDARVGGSVEVTVGRLVIGEATAVTGTLAYRSRSEAEVRAAHPAGSVIQRALLPANIRVRALAFLTLALAILALTAGGLGLAVAWPEGLEAGMDASAGGLRTWLTGLGVAASPLVAMGLVGLVVGLSPPQAGLPLLLVALPVLLGLGGLVLLGALLGAIPVAGMVGRWLLRRRSAAAAIVAGMPVLFIVLLIPWVRWVGLAALIPLGLGSWVRARPEAAT